MRTDWGRKWRIPLLAIGLATMGVSACASASHKQAACTADQISCETNDPCDESGCTNGCCLPKAVPDGGAPDAGGTDGGPSDGGCNCVIPDAGSLDGGCTTDSECGGLTPLCHTATNQCVECNEDADCDTATQVCAANVCVTAQSCMSNTDCTQPDNPVCDRAYDTCGECATDSDCPVAQGCIESFCSPYETCTNNAQCGPGWSCQPYWNGNNTEWIFICADPGTATAQGGEPCGSDSDCLSGWCESYYGDDGWCVAPCQTDSDCGPDGWCPPKGVVPQSLPGPENAGNIDETISVCMPKACTSNAQCAGTGLDGGDRACTLRIGTRTSESPDGSTTSWVESCLPPVGPKAGGTCSNDGTCETYDCLSGSCFDACATNADCPDDGGTCVQLGVDAGYVDESGNAISSCTN